MDDFDRIELTREPRSDSRIFWYDVFGRPAPRSLPVGQVVARTETCGVLVSTVLLALDHSFILRLGTAPLRIFETMIFGEHEREYQWRYSNMMEALIAHDQIVSQIEAGVILDDLIVDSTMTDIFEEYRMAISLNLVIGGVGVEPTT